MYSPRSLYADQAVQRPKRVQVEARPMPQKTDNIKIQASDIGSVFKRLANNSAKAE